MKAWWNVLRVYATTAAVVPVILGTVLAAGEVKLSWWVFILTLFCGILLQLGTNVINTYGDFKSGVDTKESVFRDDQLVTGQIKPKALKVYGIIIFAIVGIIGIYFVYLRGVPILILGIIGILFGYNYTAGIAYKYRGLGCLLVFFLMGVLMVVGAYYMQTGYFSWHVVWASLPISFLVSAIMFGNEFRDIDYDRKVGIKTLAIILGREGSRSMHLFMNVMPFLLAIILVVFRALPWPTLLVFALLPNLKRLLNLGAAVGGGNNTQADLLIPLGVKMHMQFGALQILGVILGNLWYVWF